uniref:crossover junction endodeoxyribonuclease RuvC n=1 Tax=Nocardia carnea TaxID=37328 RepID=UPI0024554F0C
PRLHFLPFFTHPPGAAPPPAPPPAGADKKQVTAMVTRILGLAAPPKPADAADALALAICHCWRAPLIERMAAAEAQAERARRQYTQRLEQQRKAVRG